MRYAILVLILAAIGYSTARDSAAPASDAVASYHAALADL